MKKVIFSVVLVIVTVVITIMVMNSGTFEKIENKIDVANNEVNYAINAKSDYVTFVTESEKLAKEKNLSGTDSYTVNVNGTEIEVTLFYINGRRVNARTYVEYRNKISQQQTQQIYDLEYENEKLNAEIEDLSTFSGFIYNKFDK